MGLIGKTLTIEKIWVELDGGGGDFLPSGGGGYRGEYNVRFHPWIFHFRFWRDTRYKIQDNMGEAWELVCRLNA